MANVIERERPAPAARPWLPAFAAPGEPNLVVTLAMLAAFSILWMVYSAVTEAPVAVKHDMLEAYTWGIEWQLGYNQHPPFWAWICGAWFTVFPRTGWAFALLSSVNAGIGLWGAWMAIGEFAAGRKRQTAWVLLLLTPLYTFYAYKYNANTIFLSLWPWMLFCFLRSLRNPGIAAGVALGVCTGFALLSKYYALILITTCFLAVIQHPGRRRYFASPAPYVAVLTAVLLCSPHVWWLFTHDAPPLRYLDSVSGWGWPHVLRFAGKTAVDAVGMNLAVIGLAAWGAWRWGRAGATEPKQPRPGLDLRVLATLALAPPILSLVSAIALRTTLTSEMTVGIFPLLPLLVLEVARPRDMERLWRLSAALALVLNVGAAAVSPAIALFRTYLSPAAMKVTPVQEVAAEATRFWHQQTGLPLAYVGGTPWYDIGTAFYSTDRPHAFVLFDYGRNLWVTPERLARHGLLSICAADDPRCKEATAEFATPRTVREDVTLTHRFWGHSARPVRFVITAIPPRE